METADQGKQLPPSAVVRSALNVGALSGTSGLLIGGITGLVRSSHPGFFALASAFQWFALGTTYWVGRGFILNAWGSELVSSRDRVYASGVAGGISGGSIGALTRGRANIIPGTIMFSIFGVLGQIIYNTLDEQHTDEVESAAKGNQSKKNVWRKVAEMKWTPVRVLSDEEYEGMLKEKLLKVDAEIAMVDEDIEKLSAQESLRSSSGRTQEN